MDLALVKQPNSVEVDNLDFMQIQNYRLSGQFDFGKHIREVRISKLAC